MKSIFLKFNSKKEAIRPVVAKPLNYISALIGIKKLQLEFNKGELPKEFCANSQLLERAILINFKK